MARWNMELTRQGFSDALMELGRETDRVVVLDADLSQSTLTKNFAKAYPGRFYDMGIAEQGMAATAAGLALMGLRPFVTSYAMFAAGRAWEIIRQQVSYAQTGVVVVGAHGGISVGKDGPTHQCVEDIALMRLLPHMTVVVPCDYWEAYKTVKIAGQGSHPFYFRMGREKAPMVTSKEDPFEIGKADVRLEGTDGTIIACGLMVAVAIEAREILEKSGIRPRILNLHTIKPIDRAAIRSAMETQAILTVEEHSVLGGMGSAVAEVVCQSERPVPMRLLGVNDRFMESGAPEDLFAQAGLTPENVAHEMTELLRKIR